MVLKIRTLLSNKTSLTAWGLSLFLHGAGIVLFLLVHLHSPQTTTEVSRFPEIQLRVLPPVVSAPAQTDHNKEQIEPPPPPPPALQTHKAALPAGEKNPETDKVSQAATTPEQAPSTENTASSKASSGETRTSDAVPAATPVTWQSLTRGRILDVPQYPAAAKRFGYEGTVRALISIAEDGTVAGVEIQRSSGYPILDRTVIDTVSSSWHFEPPGKAIKIIKDFTFKLER